MLTEKGKIIFELVKSINAGAADTLPCNLIIDKAINEYNELIKRNIIESPYKHSNNIEESEGWEESLRMFDNIMCNP